MPDKLFGDRLRSLNQDMIGRMLAPSSAATLLDVTREYLRDFHPSLFAELDWQELRPDLSSDDTRQIVGFIDDFVFFSTLQAGIARRHPTSTQEAFTPAQLASYEPILAALQQGWLGPDRSFLLAELDRYVESVRQPHWEAAEAAISAGAEEALSKALARRTDIRRVPQVIETILSNARYRYLDLPWTRRRAKSAFRSEVRETGKWGLELRLASEGDRRDLGDLARQLQTRAGIAKRCGDDGWASLLEWTETELGRLDPAALDQNEGEWTIAMTPCARCAMWFAFETVVSMDTRCSYMNWNERGVVFIPAGVGTAECPFCGCVAPVDVPIMFYAEQRPQIVYLVPTKGMLSEDDATEMWRPTIEGIRERYFQSLDAPAHDRFGNAAELVTYNIKDFLYAIQMGDTIQENHVYNLIRLSDGSALVLDGEKRFARIITPGEVDWFTATSRIEEFEGGSPSAAYDAITRTGADRDLGLSPSEAVEALLGSYADTNDAIDALIAEEKRRRE